jgi:hypothetical protein
MDMDGWQVIPGMVERGRGTIIFTGSSASVTGFAGYSDLSKWRFFSIGYCSIAYVDN